MGANPKGYTYRPTNKDRPYQAYININGKQEYIGSFPTAEEAHTEYLKKRMANPVQPNLHGNHKPQVKERCKICGVRISKNKLKIHLDSCNRIESRRSETLDAKRRLHTIEGVTKTIQEWIEVTGISYWTILNRWKRAASDHDLFKPVDQTKFKKG